MAAEKPEPVPVERQAVRLELNLDLLEPPTGGYCFLGWEDLTEYQRIELVACGFPSQFRAGVPHSLRSVLIRANADEKGRETMTRIARGWLIAEEKTAQTKPKSKYLMAMQDEIDQIENKKAVLGSARTGTLYACAEELPAYVCVQIRGDSVVPCMPGQMVMGITASRAESWVDKQGEQRWRVRVMAK